MNEWVVREGPQQKKALQPLVKYTGGSHSPSEKYRQHRPLKFVNEFITTLWFENAKQMKTINFVLVLTLGAVLSGCNWWNFKTVTGNGTITTETRSVAGFSKLSFGGPFEVQITPDEAYKCEIEADENLMDYIHVDKDGDKLKVRIRNGVNVRSKTGIKIRISMPRVDDIAFAGSGKVGVNGTIKHDGQLSLSVAGSGDIVANVHVPEVDADIAGSGSIILTGETRKAKISIAGSGDYKSAELKTETTKLSIAGSGAAWLFASTLLDVSIAGSGDVYYKGNPAEVKKSVAGAGKIQKIQ